MPKMIDVRLKIHEHTLLGKDLAAFAGKNSVRLHELAYMGLAVIHLFSSQEVALLGANKMMPNSLPAQLKRPSNSSLEDRGHEKSTAGSDATVEFSGSESPDFYAGIDLGALKITPSNKNG